MSSVLLTAALSLIASIWIVSSSLVWLSVVPLREVVAQFLISAFYSYSGNTLFYSLIYHHSQLLIYLLYLYGNSYLMDWTPYQNPVFSLRVYCSILVFPGSVLVSISFFLFLSCFLFAPSYYKVSTKALRNKSKLNNKCNMEFKLGILE